MSGARGVADGETVLAAVEVEASPERAFEAMTSAEVERPDGAVFPAEGEYLDGRRPPTSGRRHADPSASAASGTGLARPTSV
jgi:hypothetical protein